MSEIIDNIFWIYHTSIMRQKASKQYANTKIDLPIKLGQRVVLWVRTRELEKSRNFLKESDIEI